MTRRSSIVVTTIFEPAFLPGLLQNLRDHGHERATTLYVIPDRKTPRSVGQAVAAARDQGFDVQCPDLTEQAAYLERLGLPPEFVPWDSDNRRNVGFLMALEAGSEILVSIDDDNYCLPITGDFIGEHERVGSTAADQIADGAQLATPAAGWFNVCDCLDVSPACFPRGFPYFARGAARRLPTGPAGAPPSGVVAINAGLWIGDPDVDAATRLVDRPVAAALRGAPRLLGTDTWSPVNTQNTALTRDAALAYYYVRMGHPVKGLLIDRYGDILSGYLVQKCAKHLGQWIRMGTPVLEHRRTPHNLFKDLYHELAGMSLVEDLAPWLVDTRLEGSTYLDAYACLAERLQQAAASFRGLFWDDGGREFLVATAGYMGTWLGAVQRFR